MVQSTLQVTQLIRVEDEILGWSETYNRTPDGFQEVQDEIGHVIASEVQAKPAPARAKTSVPAASAFDHRWQLLLAFSHRRKG